MNCAAPAEIGPEVCSPVSPMASRCISSIPLWPDLKIPLFLYRRPAMEALSSAQAFKRTTSSAASSILSAADLRDCTFIAISLHLSTGEGKTDGMVSANIAPVQKLTAYWGLPMDVKFCKRCVFSNQRPLSTNEYAHTPDSRKETLEFDEHGVCLACRHMDKVFDEIDWKKREGELLKLLDRHRSKDGSYDVLVPGSGGKDSAMAAHVLKHKYGMHPMTVTWAPHLYTDIGWQNFQNWSHKGGFDNYLFTPNGRVHRLFTRLAVMILLHPFHPFIVGYKILVSH